MNVRTICKKDHKFIPIYLSMTEKRKKSEYKNSTFFLVYKRKKEKAELKSDLLGKHNE